jgi:DnaJ-class molecular chaperone
MAMTREPSEGETCYDCLGAGDIQPPELQGVDARFPVFIECETCNGTGMLNKTEPQGVRGD